MKSKSRGRLKIEVGDRVVVVEMRPSAIVDYRGLSGIVKEIWGSSPLYRVGLEGEQYPHELYSDELARIGRRSTDSE